VLGRPFYAGAVLLTASLALAAGCARRKSPRAAIPKPVSIGWTETGVASWYGVPYDGRRAASGEIFDMRKLTAAHPTLPFDTWVEVSNLQNGKTVNVRINDRGPFVGGRIIDLSFAAAGEIDMVRAGISRVRLKVIPAPAGAEGYAVQIGAFADRAGADAFRETVAFPDARVVQRQNLWRVVVGMKLSRDGAVALADQVRESGGEALVVREDE
jgi:rare lipoprotein A